MHNEIHEILKKAKEIENWEDRAFCWNKAYIAAELSKVAYLHIPQYELQNANRVNLIPCAKYRKLVKSSEALDYHSNNDNFPYRVVETPLVVSVVVKVSDVVFVSMRGTEKLYDWFVNLNAFKTNGRSEERRVGKECRL